MCGIINISKPHCQTTDILDRVQNYVFVVILCDLLLDEVQLNNMSDHYPCQVDSVTGAR
jgi:hypothetical protein